MIILYKVFTSYKLNNSKENISFKKNLRRSIGKGTYILSPINDVTGYLFCFKSVK